MLRNFLHSFFGFLYRWLSVLDIRDIENVPEQGGAILAPNHLSILDAPLVYILLQRKDITGLVAKKHLENPFLRWLVNSVGGIWLNRDEPDTSAIRNAVDFLKKGGMLGIAPEGTRSKTGALIAAKTGVAYLADKAQVPIIPIAITGTFRGGYQLITFHRPRISIRFGKPFLLPPVDRHDRNGSLQRNTDEIMCRIAAMLPPEYRGIYTDHPFLKELLSESKQADQGEANPVLLVH